MYEILASDFISSLDGVNVESSKVFRIDSNGIRVPNKRLKLYRLVKSEIDSLLLKYSKQSVKDIIGVYHKKLSINNLTIVGMLFKNLYTSKYIEIAKEYKDSLEDRTNNAILVRGGSQIIEMAVDFISSYDYKKISIGLAVLTGRRMAEILYTGEFDAVDSNHVFFTGQLKQNDNQGYEIPVLCDANLIVKALSNLRVLRSYKSIKNVNEKESGYLNKEVKKHFDKYSKGLSMHDLRRFYAYVCYHYNFHLEAKAENRQTFDGYTKQILGHKILKSGESYKVLEVEM